MLRKHIKPLLLLLILFLSVNYFHHDIANIWHSATHIIHSENHQHTHHSFNSHNHNEFEETHQHKLISQFISNFDKVDGSASDDESPKFKVKDFKHLTIINTWKLNNYLAENLKYNEPFTFHKVIYFPLIAPPPKS